VLLELLFVFEQTFARGSHYYVRLARCSRQGLVQPFPMSACLWPESMEPAWNPQRLSCPQVPAERAISPELRLRDEGSRYPSTPMADRVVLQVWLVVVQKVPEQPAAAFSPQRHD